MSHLKRVFESMRPDMIYDVKTLSIQTHIDEKSVGEQLHMLTKGG